LIASKAVLDAGDKDGWTALHVAAKRDHPEVIARLLDAGADIESEDESGKTPLTYATETGSMHAASLLQSRGASTSNP
jgi:ankyrin repeat protein